MNQGSRLTVNGEPVEPRLQDSEVTGCGTKSVRPELVEAHGVGGNGPSTSSERTV